MIDLIKFSILIPVYKSKYLKECIDSILMQTFNNFELIILNDDSPEDIDNIVSSYQDNRIRYYKNDKNVGAS
jgi:glycosyltransferase involved in cell wall biosynthesis